MTMPQALDPDERPAATDLDRIFEAHHEAVYRTAYRITGNGTDAEDVLQTLFLRLLRRGAAPADGAQWLPYLRSAAVNASLDVLRRRRSIPLGEMEPAIRETRPGPYELYRSQEIGDRLREALASMNPRAAAIFVLRHVEGHTNTDIARMVGTSASTVAVTLFRARRHLRKALGSFRGGQ
jgi:RNA polymerase sigma-70 factor (ECF subfamily)